MTRLGRVAGNGIHSLGDAQGGDLCRVRVVLPIEGRVHGELAPEHQLPFPPVPWSREGQGMAYLSERSQHVVGVP